MSWEYYLVPIRGHKLEPGVLDAARKLVEKFPSFVRQDGTIHLCETTAIRDWIVNQKGVENTPHTGTSAISIEPRRVTYATFVDPTFDLPFIEFVEDAMRRFQVELLGETEGVVDVAALKARLTPA